MALIEWSSEHHRRYGQRTGTIRNTYYGPNLFKVSIHSMHCRGPWIKFHTREFHIVWLSPPGSVMLRYLSKTSYRRCMRYMFTKEYKYVYKYFDIRSAPSIEEQKRMEREEQRAMLAEVPIPVISHVMSIPPKPLTPSQNVYCEHPYGKMVGISDCSKR